MEKPSNNELIFSRIVLDRAADYDISFIQDVDSLKRYTVPLASPLSVILRNFGNNRYSESPPSSIFSQEDPESDFVLERRIGNGVILLTENEDTCMISKWHNSEDYDLPLDGEDSDNYHALTPNILTNQEPDIFISIPKTEENDGFVCCLKNSEYEIILPLMSPDDITMSHTYVDM